MMDLHVHTYFSDGTLKPKEVIFLAKENGMKAVSITDHDGVDGVPEAIEWGAEYGVKVIPGVELSTGGDMGAYVHILGYGIHLENQGLRQALQEIKEQRRVRNEKLLEALNAMGYKLTIKDLHQSLGKNRGTNYIGKPVFALALKNKGYINTPKEAFREGQFLRSPEIRSIHRDKITTRKAIDLIKGAGGIAVLAHPMKISYNEDEVEKIGQLERIEQLVTRLKGAGLEGMECYYSKHLLYETECLVQMAERQGMLVTAGSDFHGPELDAGLTIGSFPKDGVYEEHVQRILNIL